MSMSDLEALLSDIRACRLCEPDLPLGANPIIRAAPGATLLIIGQAPGTKVHESSIPWNDPSGNRLRDWLQMDRDTFYDPSRVAIMPMGFCYPGRLPRGGDAPPRPECAPTWHPLVLPMLPDIRLTLLIGQYAQARYLGDRRSKTMTETVRAGEKFASEGLFPLPHPSWRNTAWAKKNPWFEAETLPRLRQSLHPALY